ncbi:MAG: DsrE family protein [Gemmatimonadota bacterium]|nr:DsrE family protein [Gemmatimonadota bacterium]
MDETDLSGWPGGLVRRDFLKVMQLIALGGGAGAVLAGPPGAESGTALTGMEQTSMGEWKMNEELVVLWTSGDRDVALKMVFMYTYYAKANGWWKDITFVIWGPSSKLLSTDIELQDYIKRMKEKGVILRACKACADSYGVSETLEKLGITVEGMGKPLTEMLKQGKKMITF